MDWRAIGLGVSSRRYWSSAFAPRRRDDRDGRATSSRSACGFCSQARWRSASGPRSASACPGRANVARHRRLRPLPERALPRPVLPRDAHHRRRPRLGDRQRPAADGRGPLLGGDGREADADGGRRPRRSTSPACSSPDRRQRRSRRHRHLPDRRAGARHRRSACAGPRPRATSGWRWGCRCWSAPPPLFPVALIFETWTVHWTLPDDRGLRLYGPDPRASPPR